MHPLWTGAASRAPSHPPAAAAPGWCAAPPAGNTRQHRRLRGGTGRQRGRHPHHSRPEAPPCTPCGREQQAGRPLTRPPPPLPVGVPPRQCARGFGGGRRSRCDGRQRRSHLHRSTSEAPPWDPCGSELPAGRPAPRLPPLSPVPVLRDHCTECTDNCIYSKCRTFCLSIRNIHCIYSNLPRDRGVPWLPHVHVHVQVVVLLWCMYHPPINARLSVKPRR